jgi:hypothetical protein
MAVCGHCWICGDKLDCNSMKNCGDCHHQILGNNTSTGVVTADDLPALVTVVGTGISAESRRICRECVVDVNSGALQGLLQALRARKDQPA